MEWNSEHSLNAVGRPLLVHFVGDGRILDRKRVDESSVRTDVVQSIPNIQLGEHTENVGLSGLRLLTQ